MLVMNNDLPQLIECSILLHILQGLTGMCYYFLRPANDKAVTPSSVANDVLFGWMDCREGKLLDGMERLFSMVMMPVLKAQEVCMCLARDWRESGIQFGKITR